MAKLFANSGNPHQMPHSDLGLHCLPIILFEVSGLHRVNSRNNYNIQYVPLTIFVYLLQGQELLILSLEGPLLLSLFVHPTTLYFGCLGKLHMLMWSS